MPSLSRSEWDFDFCRDAVIISAGPVSFRRSLACFHNDGWQGAPLAEPHAVAYTGSSTPA